MKEFFTRLTRWIQSHYRVCMTATICLIVICSIALVYHMLAKANEVFLCFLGLAFASFLIAAEQLWKSKNGYFPPPFVDRLRDSLEKANRLNEYGYERIKRATVALLGGLGCFLIFLVIIVSKCFFDLIG